MVIQRLLQTALSRPCWMQHFVGLTKMSTMLVTISNLSRSGTCCSQRWPSLESFEAILLQEELSSAAASIDAKSQTTPSTDDASPFTLFSKNHIKLDVVHISF
ncbi:hypothetical protein Vafri_17444 [Volvox africanus]|uniref:Uncharacterized protein n=1 Tax=Volvox africanus TaxID=51714 RepID=A0A8J4BK56_9CHLO|nr:hypothetical protein Vafri_17444 [Volvox africanus]